VSSHKKTFLLLFIFVILETTIFPILSQPRWIPALSFIVLTFSSLRFGARFGLAAGLLLGFCLDSLNAGPFGFFIFFYGLAGWTCGRMESMVFSESAITQWLVPGLLYAVMETGLFLMTPLEEEVSRFVLFWNMIHHSPLWVTVVASPLVYHVYERLLRPRSVS